MNEQLVHGIYADVKEVKQALMDHIAEEAPSRQYITILMEKEVRREKLVRAVVEKTLAGLVWAAVVTFGIIFWEGTIALLRSVFKWN